ncbi:MAG: late competence development ComFB family protein [Ectobacillus sp.]
MNVTNIMETIVAEVFQEFCKQHTLKCPCKECKSDILALALNRTPPKYASTQKGEILIKAAYTNMHLRQDIMKTLMFAAVQIENNPRHDITNNIL